MRHGIIDEIVTSVELFMREKTRTSDLSAEDKERLREMLQSTRVAELTEFGRAVHAEMEAILSAVRRGVSVKDANLYTTTFPCHNCAKHIVGAGIREVIYIEPYPKSLALDMHRDSTAFAGYVGAESAAAPNLQGGSSLEKVMFKPFEGVAPRRYSALFSDTSEEGDSMEAEVQGW
jgi:deoxycytidylate deaminase